MMSSYYSSMAPRLASPVCAQKSTVRFLSREAVSPPALLIEQHNQIVSTWQTRDAAAGEAAMAADVQEIGRLVPELSRHIQDWFVRYSVRCALRR